MELHPCNVPNYSQSNGKSNYLAIPHVPWIFGGDPRGLFSPATRGCAWNGWLRAACNFHEDFTRPLHGDPLHSRPCTFDHRKIIVRSEGLECQARGRVNATARETPRCSRLIVSRINPKYEPPRPNSLHRQFTLRLVYCAPPLYATPGDHFSPRDHFWLFRRVALEILYRVITVG